MERALVRALDRDGERETDRSLRFSALPRLHAGPFLALADLFAETVRSLSLGAAAVPRVGETTLLRRARLRVTTTMASDLQVFRVQGALPPNLGL